mmetsp:Transcript_30275/g.96569  ORF Transcript_30275/g.96569 Transcript_30275/m.96569 type:complete len:269 (-) Transcript_30275:216-1022(-)
MSWLSALNVGSRWRFLIFSTRLFTIFFSCEHSPSKMNMISFADVSSRASTAPLAKSRSTASGATNGSPMCSKNSCFSSRPLMRSSMYCAFSCARKISSDFNWKCSLILSHSPQRAKRSSFLDLATCAWWGYSSLLGLAFSPSSPLFLLSLLPVVSLPVPSPASPSPPSLPSPSAAPPCSAPLATLLSSMLSLLADRFFFAACAWDSDASALQRFVSASLYSARFFRAMAPMSGCMKIFPKVSPGSASTEIVRLLRSFACSAAPPFSTT